MATYEMFWDCESCGTDKLLGKTHRRCPNCGAPQDAARRYFPPDGEQVAVENHRYVGVDWVCGGCETANSRAANFCANCGAPKDGNADAPLQPPNDTRAPHPSSLQSLSSRKERASSLSTSRSGRGTGTRRFVSAVLFVVAIGLVIGLVTFFWKKDVNLVVEHRDWTREIEVEQFATRQDSAWCDSMPGDAFGVRRSREVRSHRREANGQDCHQVKNDNGDGTYSTRQECTTRYKEIPVYDDKCTYSVNRWGHARTLQSTGRGVDGAREWPTVSLRSTGTSLGSEREGARREKLNVHFLESSTSERETCAYDEATWRALIEGSSHVLRARVITGGVDCASVHDEKQR